MKTKECMRIYNNLRKVREATSVVLPAKVSFAIARNLRKLEPIVDDYNECYRELIMQNGVINPDNPNVYAVAADKIDYVNEQIDQMANMDNDISLSYIYLSDILDLQLSVDYMDALYDILIEGD